MHQLGHDLGRCEVATEALCSRVAEFALEGASRLRTHTQRPSFFERDEDGC